jgi:glycosyltransferase involved in cell wall biosynthesis
MKLIIWQSSRTMREADLVNVNNDYDRTELASRGFDLRKLVVVPLGLSKERLENLALGSEAPAVPRIAFVGSFEPRKGSVDFPEFVRRMNEALPGCRFRLLGTIHSAANVLRHFPQNLAGLVEVVPMFEPEALPGLLRDCSAGVFPSYVEGFGFGVLEMLAASLPVFAYDAPGPPMMLPAEYLVPRGAVRELASRLASLVSNPTRLELARKWARRRAEDFTWESAARITSDVYGERARLRKG